MRRSPCTIACLLALCGATLLAQSQEPTESRSETARQQSQVDLIIGNRIGAQPTFAVPDCLAPAGDESLAGAGRTIAEVLWADLEFEREFRMMARDTYESIPRARSLEAVPFDRWIQLGVDGVVSCRVESVRAPAGYRATLQHALPHVRVRRGVQRLRGQHPPLRPPVVGRNPPPAARPERCGAHENRVRVGPRQRIRARPGREPPDQGGVLRRL